MPYGIIRGLKLLFALFFSMNQDIKTYIFHLKKFVLRFFVSFFSVNIPEMFVFVDQGIGSNVTGNIIL